MQAARNRSVLALLAVVLLVPALASPDAGLHPAAAGATSYAGLQAGVQAQPAQNDCVEDGPIAPMPLLSRGVPVDTGQRGVVATLTDGKYFGGWAQLGCAPGSPCSLRLAVQQKPAPARIILAWYNTATSHYWRYNPDETTYGMIGDYTILVNGLESLRVSGNQWSRRTHLIDLAALGIRSEELRIELRIGALAARSNPLSGAAIDEIEVFDAGAGHQDTWFLIGDSVAGDAFRPAPELVGHHFRDLAARAGRHPLFVDGAVGEDRVRRLAPLVSDTLDRHPEICNWVIAVGTNDAWNTRLDEPMGWFGESLAGIARQIRARGRRAYLATLAYGEGGLGARSPFNPRVVLAFNDQIRRLLVEEKFAGGPLAEPGPDFYHALLPPANRRQDGVHPATSGARAMHLELFQTARRAWSGSGAAQATPTLPAAAPAAPGGYCAPVPRPAESANTIWFPETGHTLSDDPVRGPFLSYWRRHGGLAQFGYPIGEPALEQSPGDGKIYWTQWFERNRFEHHPEAPSEYRVLMGLLGVELLRAQGRTFPPGDPATCAAPGCAWFAPTSHSLRGDFRAYWEANGGLPIFGYPISEIVEEDGRPVQYFERNRLEYHSEHAGTPYSVLLGLLGRKLSVCK